MMLMLLLNGLHFEEQSTILLGKPTQAHRKIIIIKHETDDSRWWQKRCKKKSMPSQQIPQEYKEERIYFCLGSEVLKLWSEV